ncbi:hypothetical protein J6590_037001, partial [Homalodisca vitripennis]
MTFKRCFSRTADQSDVGAFRPDLRGPINRKLASKGLRYWKWIPLELVSGMASRALLVVVFGQLL